MTLSFTTLVNGVPATYKGDPSLSWHVPSMVGQRGIARLVGNWLPNLPEGAPDDPIIYSFRVSESKDELPIACFDYELDLHGN